MYRAFIIIALCALVLVVRAGELGYLQDHMAVLSAGALTSPLPAKVETDRRIVEIATPAGQMTHAPRPYALAAADAAPIKPVPVRPVPFRADPATAPSYPFGGQSGPVIDGTRSKKTGKRIPVRLSGDSYIVPVLINGSIWLDFIIDTGASDVSIPRDVAITLMRTGTITKEDIGGKQIYSLANGGTVKSTQFRIHSLQIGKGDNAVVAQNVTGTSSGSQGSLLLGQSFLRLFRSTTIDHMNSVLIIDDSEPRPPVPTALQPAPAPVLQPGHPANAQLGPIAPPPVPQYVCDRSPLAPPLALVMGEYVVAWRRACMEQFNMKMQIWRAELYRIQMLNQQRGY